MTRKLPMGAVRLRMQIDAAVHELAVGSGGHTQFARMLGMPKSTFSMILSGERHLPPDIEKRIYAALRIERNRAMERVHLITSLMKKFRTTEEIE